MTVSAIILTYNHVEFIGQAIESVLVQDADCELLICDDCSNDGTQDVIRAYVRDYPERIRLLVSPTNSFDWTLISQAAHLARGTYVTVTDGDDFWTRPQKLSRQAAFLEKSPDCSFCFHNVLVLDETGQQLPRLHNHCEKTLWSLADVLTNCFIQASSAMFRSQVLRDWCESPLMKACPVQSSDWGLYVFAAQRGKAGYLDDVMSVYRLRHHGLWSSIPQTAKFERIIEFYKAIAPHVASEYQSLIQEMILKRSFDLAAEYERGGDPERAALYLAQVIAARPVWAPQYIPEFHNGGWKGMERRLWFCQHPQLGRVASALQAARAFVRQPRAPTGQLPNSEAAACIRTADHCDCNVDYVNDYCEPLKGYRIMAASGGLLEVKGWAVDRESGSAAKGVELALAENLYPAEYGISRQDVADYFGVPSFRNSGFRAVIFLGQLPPGACEFRVRILLRENGDYIQSNPVSFEIVSAPAMVMDRTSDSK